MWLKKCAHQWWLSLWDSVTWSSSSSSSRRLFLFSLYFSSLDLGAKSDFLKFLPFHGHDWIGVFHSLKKKIRSSWFKLLFIVCILISLKVYKRSVSRSLWFLISSFFQMLRSWQFCIIVRELNVRNKSIGPKMVLSSGTPLFWHIFSRWTRIWPPFCSIFRAPLSKIHFFAIFGVKTPFLASSGVLWS